jgi:apolipoprotein D and lipocalin family protein
MHLMKLITAALFSLLLTGPVLARDTAPQPAKPVAPAFFSGRWYEIARTDNFRQAGCEAPTYDFGAPKGDTRSFVLTCRKGSPTGKAESISVSIRMPADSLRNKFKVSAMGGVLRQEYWVLDRADDLSWAIMATPGGNYVWLLARSPKLDTSVKGQLLNRIKGMGYDLGKIVQPRHG